MLKDIHPNDPINLVTEKIIESSIKIHRQYGPGLLENAYEQLLVYELTHNQKLKTEAQKSLPIIHEGQKIDAAYRLDLLVENDIIVELKAQDKILPIHEAQILTYLKLSEKRIGLILNFNAKLMKDGIRRFIL